MNDAVKTKGSNGVYFLIASKHGSRLADDACAMTHRLKVFCRQINAVGRAGNQPTVTHDKFSCKNSLATAVINGDKICNLVCNKRK